MRPSTKRITEYGGPLAPVPARGFDTGGPIGRATSSANKAKGIAAEQGGHLDSPLPDGIVTPGQYEDVAKEVIAAVRSTRDEAERKGVTYDVQPVRDLLAKLTSGNVSGVPEGVVEGLQRSLDEYEDSQTDEIRFESFTWRRQPLPESRLANVANRRR